MDGIIELNDIKYTQMKEDTEKLKEVIENLPEYQVEFFGAYHQDSLESMQKTIVALEKCIPLEQSFKSVTIDQTATRIIKCKCKRYGDDSMADIVVPLIWNAKVPLGTFHEMEIRGYKIKTRTPAPVKKAIEEIKKHKDKFDEIQLWWVPRDFIVEKIPDPDPIIVGVIKSPAIDFCFELHRWIDESVEDEYWTKEGY